MLLTSLRLNPPRSFKSAFLKPYGMMGTRFVFLKFDFPPGLFLILSLHIFPSSTCGALRRVKPSDVSFCLKILSRLLRFRWLNKLGVAAQRGYKVIIRQSMFRGHYSLLGRDLEPNPVSRLVLSPCSHYAFINLLYDREMSSL